MDTGGEPKAIAKACRACGDDVGLRDDGQPFVACAECAFPVCRPCYEYERSDGTQRCPQCNTRYKRLRGSPRVEGDEEDADMDDFEEEFQAKSPKKAAHEPAPFDVYSVSDTCNVFFFWKVRSISVN